MAFADSTPHYIADRKALRPVTLVLKLMKLPELRPGQDQLIVREIDVLLILNSTLMNLLD